MDSVDEYLVLTFKHLYSSEKQNVDYLVRDALSRVQPSQLFKEPLLVIRREKVDVTDAYITSDKTKVDAEILISTIRAYKLNFGAVPILPPKENESRELQIFFEKLVTFYGKYHDNGEEDISYCIYENENKIIDLCYDDVKLRNTKGAIRTLMLEKLGEIYHLKVSALIEGISLRSDIENLVGGWAEEYSKKVNAKILAQSAVQISATDPSKKAAADLAFYKSLHYGICKAIKKELPKP